jgi:uncharacterized membrane protein (DUF2068 family)
MLSLDRKLHEKKTPTNYAGHFAIFSHACFIGFRMTSYIDHLGWHSMSTSLVVTKKKIL